MGRGERRFESEACFGQHHCRCMCRSRCQSWRSPLACRCLHASGAGDRKRYVYSRHVASLQAGRDLKNNQVASNQEIKTR